MICAVCGAALVEAPWRRQGYIREDGQWYCEEPIRHEILAVNDPTKT